jgi:hypothetical protein
MAASASELKALKEMERQLSEWKREGRIEDLKIIKSRQSALVQQVEWEHVDLQAIQDDHNNNLKTKTATVQGRNQHRPLSHKAVTLRSFAQRLTRCPNRIDRLQLTLISKISGLDFQRCSPR